MKASWIKSTRNSPEHTLAPLKVAARILIFQMLRKLLNSKRQPIRLRPSRPVKNWPSIQPQNLHLARDQPPPMLK